MPVFFLPPESITYPSITVPSALQAHLRDSLRLELGEQIWVCDGQGSRYLMELTRVTKQELAGRILNTFREPARTAPRLLIGQAVLKGEKMDWVIQKATELGASEIVLLQSRHTIVQLRPERLDAQLARWQRIALEAAQQSEQWRVPVIAHPQSLAECLTRQPTPTLSLMLTERVEEKMKNSKVIWKKVCVLTLVGGLAFWLANFAISRTAIAAEYRAAMSISYYPMLLESLIGGLIIGLWVSYPLLRFFDRILVKDPILKSVFLSSIVLVIITILLGGPSSYLATNNVVRYFIIGTVFNVIRILALGITIGYVWKKQYKGNNSAVLPIKPAVL